MSFIVSMMHAVAARDAVTDFAKGFSPGAEAR